MSHQKPNTSRERERDTGGSISYWETEKSAINSKIKNVHQIATMQEKAAVVAGLQMTCKRKLVYILETFVFLANKQATGESGHELSTLVALELGLAATYLSPTKNIPTKCIHLHEWMGS